ncbi:MAG TPA: DUF885 family protein [Caulobacteraceae bacterium]|nr:DUF885 family protein [Caulobacteraceae bacterium]
MKITRRQTLLTAAAAAAAPLAAFAQDSEDARLSHLFDALFQEGLRRNPEGATQLGLDTGANADLRSKLRDQSLKGLAEDRALNADQLRRLAAINRAALGEAGKVDFDTVVYTRRSTAAIMAFGYGGTGFGGAPYVVSQDTGAYQSVPDFLDTKHRIAGPADADAYLSRLAAYAVQLDDETQRMNHDAALGVVPPDFILDTTISQMAAARVPAEESTLVKSIRRRAAAKGLAARYGDDAARIYSEKVLPALDRQIAAAHALRPRARHEAGIGHLPNGEAYYAAALHASTTTTMTPDEVHRLGLDQGEEISARIDELLKARGLTQGTVGERIGALYKDPASFFPDTDAGKAAAIAFCNDRLAAIRPRLPTRFKRLPPYAFEVHRVPPEIEAGAASAYSQGPAIDGSRPGIVYINLRDTAEWPRWSLSSVIFHEGLPGHQLEGGLALSNKSLPLIRKTIGFSGYAEGWALYAEQLADEMGMYEADPLSRIGYLRFQLFRAGRCVVDTGIHHLGWSREKAVAYFEALDADAPGFATREVDRYCTNPGQACSYKIGHTVWLKARARAVAALGPRYDIKDFHEAGLNCGRVPLDILDGVIDRWIAARKAA